MYMHMSYCNIGCFDVKKRHQFAIEIIDFHINPCNKKRKISKIPDSNVKSKQKQKAKQKAQSHQINL